MSHVIAGIYEIGNKIGAGGGGTVYLGRHLRLEKQVVLKADKRQLSTKPEVLRREVDMLKNLSHTYIPQVYDFVQENGVVYTVMDYIEGESLDKLLGSGRKISQPEVIRWACQLLRALVYLHGRPPHGVLHGDIKPANIMLRPGGDICLIDYNIALALGEDGAVKVGFSRGYASPEHYGADYLKEGKAAAIEQISVSATGPKGETTEVEEDADKTIADNGKEDVASASGGSNGSRKGLLLDARSDIYSLGATLYHLLSGRRPVQDAREVEPLREDVCSPAVSVIIQKSMAPEPSMRYQTAIEMLEDFLQLPKKDVRVIRNKRRMAVLAATAGAAFLAGGISTFVGLKQLEQRQSAFALAEYSASALAEGDISEAVSLALQAVPTGKSILEGPMTAQAQKALTDALGVYDLRDGFQAVCTVELPSAPFKIVVSPKGTYFAVVYAYQAEIFRMEDQQSIVTLSIQESALADVVFSDETHIVYAGKEGVTAYDLKEKMILWQGRVATTLAVSGDGGTVAAVNRECDYAVFYNIETGKETEECSFREKHLQVPYNDTFADAGQYVFALNEDGSLLAVSFSDGGLILYDRKHPDEEIVLYEKSDYRSITGGFSGKYFAFAANGDTESLFGLADMEQEEYLGDYVSRDTFLVQAEKGNIYLANGNLLVMIDPATMEEAELAYTDHETITGFSVGEGYVLTATDSPGFSFYNEGAEKMSSEITKENCDFVKLCGKYAIVGNRNEPSLRILKAESHSESQLLTYDAHYDHDETRIAADRQTVMLFQYQNFRIYDMNGNLVKETELPDAEKIYDQQFIKERKDSWLEVTWYDGTVRCYSAADGTLLSEEAGTPKDKEIQDIFYTDKYKILSSLHGEPEVYDIKSGKPAGMLEKDSYLTYVTQVGEYIMTEYISAEGNRYGLLLDGDLQTLAYLPDLCDIIDEELIFDDQSGNLRYCRLYSIQELLALGENYITTKEGGTE